MKCEVSGISTFPGKGSLSSHLLSLAACVAAHRVAEVLSNYSECLPLLLAGTQTPCFLYMMDGPSVRCNSSRIWWLHPEKDRSWISWDGMAENVAGQSQQATE